MTWKLVVIAIGVNIGWRSAVVLVRKYRPKAAWWYYHWRPDERGKTGIAFRLLLSQKPRQVAMPVGGLYSPTADRYVIPLVMAGPVKTLLEQGYVGVVQLRFHEQTGWQMTLQAVPPMYAQER